MNRGNPAPEEAVYWGLQSEEEMLYGSVGYSWVDETSSKPIHDRARVKLYKMMGIMDQNLDGKITKSELTRDLNNAIGDRFTKFDLSKDGALDLNELAQLLHNSR